MTEDCTEPLTDGSDWNFGLAEWTIPLAIQVFGTWKDGNWPEI